MFNGREDNKSPALYRTVFTGRIACMACLGREDNITYVAWELGLVHADAGHAGSGG